jgi:hypothetical protein
MPVDLGYTVTGRGGTAFWWLDNAGGTPWSAMANYNFNLFPGAQGSNWDQVATGSFLLSTPFSLLPGQKLTVVASILTAHSMPYEDVGFALLLQGSQVKAVLFALRPDGWNNRGDYGPIPGTVFAPPSAGVTVNKVVGGPVKVVLGGVEYGQVNDPGDCSGKCCTEVTTSYIPGGGTYNLLFGMFNLEGHVNSARPAALIVKFAGV